jgi:hypothetical protein
MQDLSSQFVNNPNYTLQMPPSYRGATPIWAWVGEWTPYVLTDANGNIINSNLPGDINSYLSVAPSWGGTTVSMYSSPSYVQSVSPVSSMDAAQSQLGGSIGGLSTTSPSQPYYIPITLSKFGAYATFGPWWAPGSTYYYPSASLHIRALYAVWGEWVYLWTAQEAQNQGYKWENVSSYSQTNPSWVDQIGALFGGFANWISNPLNQVWALLFIVVAVIVVVSVASPSVWTMLASRKSSKGNG